MKYVCSKLASDNRYALWKDESELPNDLPQIDKSVLIKGGSGVANKNVITPYGIVTEITDEQCEFLEKNEAFKRHKERGFVKILAKHPHDQTEKVAADLADDEGSAPLTPEKAKKEMGAKELVEDPKKAKGK